MTREEAIEVYRGLINTKIKEAFEFFAPELAESEDERIRKWLIDDIKRRSIGWTHSEFTGEQILAWLEKQKEQKPASTEDMPYITDEHFYEREPADSFKYKLAEYMTKCCTKKEGPYGYTYGISAESILKMAKEELIKRGELQKPVESISQLTVQGKGVYKICPRCKSCMIRDDSKVYTSMPPQYGYECPKCGEMEFDTVMYDNPEMEERKSAEWSENDTVFLNEIIDYFENKTVRLQHDIDMYAHWLKSLPERFNLQPKQEWSKKDERMRDGLITRLNWITYNTKTNDTSPNITFFDEIDWLKSLRPQPKAEWSEYDKVVINNIVLWLSGSFISEGARNECLKWFNEHRRDFLAHPHWKPSEEQMRALEECGECKRCVKELYEQLKKL